MKPSATDIAMEREGAGHVLRAEIWLPRPIGDVFAFFSDAHNLRILTPDFMHFQILTPGPIVMRVGALIDYRIRVHGVPLKWRTRITAWEPPYRFDDVQIRGPYRVWEHTHTFEERDGGTLCRDRVRYAVPGGPLVRKWIVEPDLRRIFSFRRAKLAELFGTEPAGAAPVR